MPFSQNLVGLGGFTNGEITCGAGAHPSVYRQRLFLRQIWNRDGTQGAVEPDLNQMAGWASKNRFVLTAGNFSTLYMFDGNAYAKGALKRHKLFYDWMDSARTELPSTPKCGNWPPPTSPASP